MLKLSTIAGAALGCLVVLAIVIILPGTASADIVANGGFETGDFTDWTQSGNTGFIGVSNNYPHSGTYAAQLGPGGSLGFITQNLITVPGQTYQLTYWLANTAGGAGACCPSEFQTSWNGTVISDLVDPASAPYAQ